MVSVSVSGNVIIKKKCFSEKDFVTFLLPIFFVYSCNIGLCHVNVFITYFPSFPNHMYLHFSVLRRLSIAVSAARRFTVTQSCHTNQSIVLKDIITFSNLPLPQI